MIDVFAVLKLPELPLALTQIDPVIVPLLVNEKVPDLIMDVRAEPFVLVTVAPCDTEISTLPVPDASALMPAEPPVTSAPMTRVELPLTVCDAMALLVVAVITPPAPVAK